MDWTMDISNYAKSWLFQNINVTNFRNVFHVPLSEAIVTWILFFIELPVVCMSLYGLCFMTRTDRVSPVFVINLFISDLIQICFKPLIFIVPLISGHFILLSIYIIGMMANIGFMVCISLERYVMITHPVWYRLCHSFKYSVYACLLIWLLSIIQIGIVFAFMKKGNVENAFAVSLFFLLLPYPLVVFFFVCSWRALSNSISVPPEEQRRILRILALVLFNYTVLFLPIIILNTFFSVSRENGKKSSLRDLRVVAGVLVYLNPLVDCLLYVFMRKDVKGMLLSFCYVKDERDTTQTLNTIVDRCDEDQK